MFADALVTLGASASAGMELTPEAWIFCLQHQKSNDIKYKCIFTLSGEIQAGMELTIAS